MFDLIRVLDIIISLLLLVLLSPILLLIFLIIKISSKGPAIFCQQRVGKDNKDFTLYKFRTMYVDADRNSLTVGNKDTRITKVGYILRRYKIDELLQLFNVLKNDMSIVGPRPELRKYVDHYTEEQKQILSVKPGITDYASIFFRHENELLAIQQDPEAFYIKEVLPVKIQLNERYVLNRGIRAYFVVIFRTILSVFK